MTKRFAVENVSVLEDGSYADCINSRLDLKNKILICLSITPDPEAHNDREEMVKYRANINKTIVDLGVATSEAMSKLKDFFRSAKYLNIAFKFGDIKTAQNTFERLMEAGVADIYLYENGRLVDKYD